MKDNLAVRLTEDIAAFCRANMTKKKPIPIRSSEMGVLIYIVRHAEENGVRSVDLSNYFGIQKSSVSSIISSLASQGYIKKVSSKDKRSNPLVASDKGINLVENTYEDYHNTSEKIIDKLGKETCEQFLSVMAKITKIIQEDEG